MRGTDHHRPIHPLRAVSAVVALAGIVVLLVLAPAGAPTANGTTAPSERLHCTTRTVSGYAYRGPEGNNYARTTAEMTVCWRWVDALTVSPSAGPISTTTTTSSNRVRSVVSVKCTASTAALHTFVNRRGERTRQCHKNLGAGRAGPNFLVAQAWQLDTTAQFDLCTEFGLPEARLFWNPGTGRWFLQQGTNSKLDKANC